MLYPEKKELVPPGYTLLERTPFKYEADLNAGSNATSISICYKQRLLNVEQLSSVEQPRLITRETSFETTGSGNRTRQHPHHV